MPVGPTSCYSQELTRWAKTLRDRGATSLRGAIAAPRGTLASTRRVAKVGERYGEAAAPHRFLTPPAKERSQ